MKFFIDTGSVAEVEELVEPFAALGEQYTGKVTGLLYGGSVKPTNIAEIMDEADVDGALVGGASLVAEDFLK